MRTRQKVASREYRMPRSNTHMKRGCMPIRTRRRLSLKNLIKSTVGAKCANWQVQNYELTKRRKTDEEE